MPREVCMISAKAGRDTPCHWDCGTYCRRRTARTVRGFRPTDIDGLAAWFQNNFGITTVSGAVSQWDDQSGNGRHLKQATATNRPALQADGSILFDGVDNYLKCDAFTLNQPTTVYFLGKQVTWTDIDGIFDGNAASSGLLQQRTTTPGIRLVAGSATGLNSDLVLDTYGVVTSVFNGASSVLVVNKGTAVTGNAGASNMGGFKLGANATPGNYANIQVKEVILYSGAHNADTREVIINYLMNLGGL